MVPARGLGWPAPPQPSAAPAPEPGGLHRGHSEPEGPELADGPRSDGPRSDGLGSDGLSPHGPRSDGLRPEVADERPSQSTAGSQTGPVGLFSEVNGLGWPQNFSNDTALGAQPLSRADAPGADVSNGPGVILPTNGTDVLEPASQAPTPRPPAPPSPARVQQALSAAVSRETGALSTDGARASAPIGN